MFSVKPLKPTFKSYLPPVQADATSHPQPTINKLEAKLLAGEIVVNEANFVRKCIGADSGHGDLWGKLICTNFKISFITQETLRQQKFQYVNQLLGVHDIPLACVGQVVAVNGTKGKRKVLRSNQKLKFSPTELLVHCKDFRIVRFRFDEAGPESAKKVCLAIAHYAQPSDPQLLFGFEYVGERPHGPHGPSGDQANGVDPGAARGRPPSLSAHLPEYFVVPASLADSDLKQFSGFFTAQRLPLWCWNHQNGSALVRMASIRDPAQHRKLDQRICNAVTMSHPKRGDVLKADLDRSLPSIQDVQAAFVRLRQICVIEPFEESEEKWLSSMESCRWLEYVRAFLKQSAEVVYMLEGEQASVILQEDEGRDLSCVVSSLVQLILDAHFRSLTGFQSLVQKEWVMAGHRFLDRCNHLKKSSKEESPLFLLFLDCVWQLMDQYPSAFQFTDTYLTVLSDSMWIPVFSTFLFNCPRQRAEHSRDFAQMWDWSQQFTLKDQALFNSPLYVGKSASCVQKGAVKTFRCTKKNYSSTLRAGPSLKTQPREAPEGPSDRFSRAWFSRPADPRGLLLPQLLPSHLRLWRLYFLRWVAEAQIPRGGPVAALHKLSLLAGEIETLRGQLLLRQHHQGAAPRRLGPRHPAAPRAPRDPLAPEYVTSSFPFSPVGPNLCRRGVLDTPLSKFLGGGGKVWLSTETIATETI
ncbi:hypothetical protein AAFF_G00087290 [Aldrovandia affinis]|uniref:Myotubularin phosphatase domain-containing protein n=1 Tax=Aldrovandia affinis TaxID=143900 RepID=A0AAD7WCE3_9TELE|nr:hypothetical protein AAFF_G00087290 [Aldrovandia affinis]